MKAARIHAFGGSEKVKVETIDVPKVKKGTALVRVRAAGVNPVDWAVREKIYNPKGADKLPLTLGQDFAGVIEEIARLVERKVVRPHISRILPLGQVRRALDLNEKGRSHGKIVLDLT